MSTPFVGDTLYVENLNPSGFPKPTIVYSWLRDGEAISGASGATYEVVGDDTGSNIGVKIIISNIYGESSKIISTDESGGVLELPSFLQQPFLRSSADPPTEQVEVFIDNLVVGGEPTPTVSYKWYRGSDLISGANSSSYTPIAADVGHTLSAEITATNVGGSAVTTVYASDTVERADLAMSFVSIVSPVFSGRIAETITDAVGYDILSYNWQANTGSNYFTFSTEPVRTEISTDYLGFPIRCTLTAIRSGETDIAVTSNPVTVSQPAGQVQGSYSPQGVLEPGAGYSESFVEKSTTRRSGNADVFASESYPAFKIGFPEQYTMGADGFTLDMYAFHGAGIESVIVSCDGGTGVTAGFEQSGGDTGEGYFYVGISADKFTAGGTFEIRATANPVNGYSRSQKLLLTHATGENKISIDTSTTWRDAYDSLLENYDESKRNIIELTETGEYILEGSSTSYRGFTHGWIEVVPADGVVPTIDLSTGGINRSGEDDNIRPRMNALKVTNCIFKRLTVDETETNYDNGWYTEDFSNSRMWFHGCTFQSDWFDTGEYDLNPNRRLLGFIRIGEPEGKAISFEDCYFDQTPNGPLGAHITKNVTCNKTVKDTFTNVKACINSQSTDKLDPANPSLHADHWQLFTNNVTDGLYLVENRILYGYTGADYDSNIQPFGFFGTGRETYRDIAIVHSGWTGPKNQPTQAQLGYTYDHVILNGMELYKRTVNFRESGTQIGPVLVRGVNAPEGGHIYNGNLHPLDVLAGASFGPGVTNEFRFENTSPDVEFLGPATTDSALSVKYEWHISGASMASVVDKSTYALDADGTNTQFYIGATGSGSGGDKATTDIFKSNATGRLGYWNEFSGGLRTFVLSNIRDLESAEELVDQDLYMTVQSDKGSMTSTNFRRREDSNVCDFNGFYTEAFGGVTMSFDDLVTSTSGVTLQLKSPINLIDRARWLTDSTPSETFPVPGATLNVVLGNYEGTPTPSVSYVWKKDPLGGTNYSVISGVTGATLDLTANPLAPDTSIRCDVSITNSTSSETQYVDFGKVADWDTYKDGVFRFPRPLTTGYGNLTEVESSVEFPNVTQASLVDATHDFRISSTSIIVGKLYAAVWDGSAWSTYESWNTISTEQRFLDLLGSGGAPSENQIVVLYRNDPGDPSQFNAYPAEPTFGTFTDLRALISKGSGVLDLNGSTFEAEASDFDPDDSYRGAIRINASDFTEVKNGTIIAGRKGSWNGPDSNGIYSADLTSTEVEDFLIGPRFYMYDPTLSEQPGLALYPEGPSSMTPRYTLGYHSNFLYTKALERFTPSDSDRGYVYTHGRSFTLSTDSTYENSDFRSNDVIYLGENTNETTATAKGIVHTFRNVTSSNPTPTVHLKDLYYRDGSGEFVLDTREAGNFDQSTYNAFNSGDVVTNARTGQTYTMETTTNLDSEGAQIYGFKLTHQPSIDTVNALFTDTDNKSFSIIAKTQNNVIVTGYVNSYNQTTGIFELDSFTARYLGYFNFAITGIPEVLNTVSYASYCLDSANSKMLYKPASGTPENIYIPNMRHGVIITGKTDDDIEVPTLKLTNLKFYLGNSATTSPGTLRQTQGPFNLTIDNCRFEYNSQGIRFSVQKDSNVHLKNSVFKDNAFRFTNGFGPGVTVERNIFDGTQSSSALNPNFPNDGNTAEVQELVVIRDNIFSLPATNHGQAISAYEASHTNMLVEHNIFYNCQRPASAQFGAFASDPPVGGTCEFNNNLFISDGYADNVTIYQSGIAFQAGDVSVNMDSGEHKILFRSNTMFVNHETAQPDGTVIGKPCQIWQVNSAKATVSYLNNFAYGGIVVTAETVEDELGDGVPHNFANNFSDGFVFDPEMNSFNTAFGSTDIKLPAGLSLSDVYGVTTCAVTGPLATGGSDGGLVGIRWNPIPTIQQINDILTNETTDWADTYPALSIPLTPGEAAYSTAFAGEDNRVGALVPLQPIGTTYDVRVVDIGVDDEHSRVFSIDGNIYTEVRLNTGVTYEFNQSHISNIGYGFLLSATADGTNAGGTAFTDGFSYTGTPGSDGVATFVPPSGSPSVLYYYADGESGMGGVIGITSA